MKRQAMHIAMIVSEQNCGCYITVELQWSVGE